MNDPILQWMNMERRIRKIGTSESPPEYPSGSHPKGYLDYLQEIVATINSFFNTYCSVEMRNTIIIPCLNVFEERKNTLLGRITTEFGVHL